MSDPFVASYTISFGDITEADTPDLQHWQLSDPETLKSIGALEKRGVRRLKWKAHAGCCDDCLKNSGRVVRVSEPFPSGAVYTPEHNRCICECEELED